MTVQMNDKWQKQMEDNAVAKKILDQLEVCKMIAAQQSNENQRNKKFYKTTINVSQEINCSDKATTTT